MQPTRRSYRLWKRHLGFGCMGLLFGFQDSRRDLERFSKKTVLKLSGSRGGFRVEALRVLFPYGSARKKQYFHETSSSPEKATLGLSHVQIPVSTTSTRVVGKLSLEYLEALLALLYDIVLMPWHLVLRLVCSCTRSALNPLKPSASHLTL